MKLGIFSCTTIILRYTVSISRYYIKISTIKRNFMLKIFKIPVFPAWLFEYRNTKNL